MKKKLFILLTLFFAFITAVVFYPKELVRVHKGSGFIPDNATVCYCRGLSENKVNQWLDSLHLKGADNIPSLDFNETCYGIRHSCMITNRGVDIKNLSKE